MADITLDFLSHLATVRRRFSGRSSELGPIHLPPAPSAELWFPGSTSPGGRYVSVSQPNRDLHTVTVQKTAPHHAKSLTSHHITSHHSTSHHSSSRRMAESSSLLFTYPAGQMECALKDKQAGTTVG